MAEVAVITFPGNSATVKKPTRGTCLSHCVSSLVITVFTYCMKSKNNKD